jgi:hypothetical protein
MAEFTLFPKLPLELRRRVWNFAASMERIIEIRWNHCKDWYYCSTPPPSVLHASRESRIEALMCYELLEIENRWNYMGLLAMLRTYINYQRDTIYLSAVHIDMPYTTTPALWGYFHLDFVSQALPLNDKLYRIALRYSEKDPEVYDHTTFLFRRPNLEVIYLVFLDRCCLDRNIPHINASHFTEPCQYLLNGEFRTTAKGVYEELLEYSNELIEMEEVGCK